MEMSADRSGAWIAVCKFDPVRSGDGVAAKELKRERRTIPGTRCRALGKYPGLFTGRVLGTGVIPGSRY